MSKYHGSRDAEVPIGTMHFFNYTHEILKLPINIIREYTIFLRGTDPQERVSI